MRLPRPSRPSFSSDDGVTYRGAYGEAASLLPCLAVGATDAASGGAVYKLRYALAQKGFLDSRQVNKNAYGETLRAAVISFQAANNLAPDGIVGPDTWGKLGLKGAPCAKTTGTGQTVGPQVTAPPVRTTGAGAGLPAALPAKKVTEQPWFWPAVVGGSALTLLAVVYGVRRYQASKPSVRRNYANKNKAKSAGLIALFNNLGKR